jgi:hypothetical protein
MKKTEISTEDLATWPVWHFDPESELFSPLESLDSLIGSIDELHFFAAFTTPQGFELRGSISGRGDIAVGIFRNGRWYAVNRNWREVSMAQLDALAIESPDLGVTSGKELLPLRFKALIDKEPYTDWTGEFNLP